MTNFVIGLFIGALFGVFAVALVSPARDERHIESLNGTGCRAWIDASEELPEYCDLVLCIVDGRPCENINLMNSYATGALLEDGTWCLDAWPDWEGARIKYWCRLPDAPEK